MEMISVTQRSEHLPSLSFLPGQLALAALGKVCQMCLLLYILLHLAQGFLY